MPDLRKVVSGVTRPLMEMIVFPIIKALYYSDGAEVHKIVGTGFFLDSSGIFLTAAHVFQGRGSALDLEGAKRFAVYCVHSVHIERRMVARHIDVASIKTRRDTDIAAGRVEMNQFGKGDDSIKESELRNTAAFDYVTGEVVPVGTRIWTVAYPLSTVSNRPGQVSIHAQSDSFEGSITKHYPNGRDSVLLPFPCYETDMEIMKGASGGPVFISESDGVVFGVNCAGMELHTVSHVASLSPVVSGSATPKS